MSNRTVQNLKRVCTVHWQLPELLQPHRLRILQIHDLPLFRNLFDGVSHWQICKKWGVYRLQHPVLAMLGTTRYLFKMQPPIKSSVPAWVVVPVGVHLRVLQQHPGRELRVLRASLPHLRKQEHLQVLHPTGAFQLLPA